MVKKVFFITFCLLLLTSCIIFQKEEKTEAVRIVDPKGNPIHLERKRPKFNEEQLSKQEKIKANKIQILNDSTYYDGDLPNGLFEDKSTETQIEVQKGINEKVIFKATEEEKKLKQNIVKKKKTKRPIKKKVSTKKKTPVATKTKTKSTTKKKKRRKRAIPKASLFSEKGPFYIQIGAYKAKNSANKSLKKYSSIHSGKIKSYKSKKGYTIYRTVLGPYETKRLAETDLEKVIKRGHYDVYITKQ